MVNCNLWTGLRHAARLTREIPGGHDFGLKAQNAEQKCRPSQFEDDCRAMPAKRAVLVPGSGACDHPAGIGRISGHPYSISYAGYSRFQDGAGRTTLFETPRCGSMGERVALVGPNAGKSTLPRHFQSEAGAGAVVRDPGRWSVTSRRRVRAIGHESVGGRDRSRG